VDKVDEARELLKMLGMPKAQQADICCYVLLAMARIKQDTAWVDARNEWIRIHDIIQFTNTYYELPEKWTFINSQTQYIVTD